MSASRTPAWVSLVSPSFVIPSCWRISLWAPSQPKTYLHCTSSVPLPSCKCMTVAVIGYSPSLFSSRSMLTTVEGRSTWTSNCDNWLCRLDSVMCWPTQSKYLAYPKSASQPLSAWQSLTHAWTLFPQEQMESPFAICHSCRMTFCRPWRLSLIIQLPGLLFPTTRVCVRESNHHVPNDWAHTRYLMCERGVHQCNGSYSKG